MQFIVSYLKATMPLLFIIIVRIVLPIVIQEFRCFIDLINFYFDCYCANHRMLIANIFRL